MTTESVSDNQEDRFVPWEQTEDEPPTRPIRNEDLLNWRMPPDESFSDWTIEIVTKESTTTPETSSENETIKFHVHKVFLAVGPKKSLYFQRLFQNDNFREADTQTSRIQLHTPAACAFSDMLDYLYSTKPQNALHGIIATENAAALHHLGQYFDIPLLRAGAMSFCEKNLNISNCSMYYEHAKLFNDEALLTLIAKLCCNQLDKIALDADILKLSDVALWRNVVHWLRQGIKARKSYNSKYLSRLIVAFCTLHQSEQPMSAEAFIDLTDPTLVTEVDNDVAVELLQLEGNILPYRKTCETLSNLQCRCVDAVANCWESIDVQALQHDLCGLNPGLMFLAFSRALEEAQRQKDWLETLVCERIVVAGADIAEANGTYF